MTLHLEYLNKRKEHKELQLTHIQCETGWKEVRTLNLEDAHRIVYLGKCNEDGDMFAVYEEMVIYIYKGHLNNGEIPNSYIE